MIITFLRETKLMAKLLDAYLEKNHYFLGSKRLYHAKIITKPWRDRRTAEFYASLLEAAKELTKRS